MAVQGGEGGLLAAAGVRGRARPARLEGVGEERPRTVGGDRRKDTHPSPSDIVDLLIVRDELRSCGGRTGLALMRRRSGGSADLTSGAGPRSRQLCGGELPASSHTAQRRT